MLQQPLRLGGLALVCALATSVLAIVTFLASNLVVSVIGGAGGVGTGSAVDTAPEPPATAVLLSSTRDDHGERRGCRDRVPERDAVRCDGRRHGGGADRP